MLAACTLGDLREVLEANGNPAFAVEIGPDGAPILAAANARLARAAGLEPAAGTGLKALFPAPAGALVENLCRSCVASARPVEFDTDIAFPTGAGPWRVALVPVADAAGRTARILGTATPVAAETIAWHGVDEGRLSALLEIANVAVLLDDPEGAGIVYANSYAERLFGRPLVGIRYFDLVVPEDLEALRGWRAETISGRSGSHRAERRFRRGDGVFLAETAGFSFRDRRTGRRLWIALIQDLSPARVIQLRLRDALDASAEAFALFDPEDRLMLCNQAYARRYERAPELLVGQTFEALQHLAIHTCDGPVIAPGAEAAWITERVARHRRADGTPRLLETAGGRWFLIREERTADGCIVLVRSDVTDLKRREAALVESETLLRQAAAMARLGYWVWDEAEDRCTHCSEELAAVHELTVEDYLREAGSLAGLLSRIHPEDRRAYEAALRQGRERGEPLDMELRVVARTGEVRHIREKVEFIRDGQGRILRSLGIVQDITEQKRRERDLEQAREEAERSSRAKSKFLAHMSHELRTPLNAILGFSELLQIQLDGPLGSERYLGYAGDIKASASHLLELINDLLDLAKIEAERFELDEHPVDMARVLARAARLVSETATRKHLQLTVTADPMPPVLADERALRQIVVNLLSNAVKFTPAEGQVELRASLTPAGPTITVRDTGVGIPAENLSTIFEPFAQASHTRRMPEAGTGLGLPIVRALVDLHGGGLAIASDPGRGTTVTITLPASRLQPATGTEAGA